MLHCGVSGLLAGVPSVTRWPVAFAHIEAPMHAVNSLAAPCSRLWAGRMHPPPYLRRAAMTPVRAVERQASWCVRHTRGFR